MATIELLHVAHCPNSEKALVRLRLAVENTMPSSTPIKSTLIDSAATAARLPFAGSPTILVDGVDLFPTDGRTSDLACRIYPTPHGLAGSPTQQQIEAALAPQVARPQRQRLHLPPMRTVGRTPAPGRSNWARSEVEDGAA